MIIKRKNMLKKNTMKVMKKLKKKEQKLNLEQDLYLFQLVHHVHIIITPQ